MKGVSIMAQPLSFRPVGKAKFFGDRGPEITEFLKQEFGGIPATITVDDIPRLEKWYVSKGGNLPVRGSLGILIHKIREFEMVQVGYFDVV
jgi:hypothetical protein